MQLREAFKTDFLEKSENITIVKKTHTNHTHTLKNTRFYDINDDDDKYYLIYRYVYKYFYNHAEFFVYSEVHRQAWYSPR